MFTELATSGLLSQGLSESRLRTSPGWGCPGKASLRTAEDGHQAIAQLDDLQQQDPNAKILAFLDVRMPNLDGEETAKEIRARQVGRPPFLVCCSANVESLCACAPDELFHMLMPKNFMDSSALLACFSAAEEFWSQGGSGGSSPVEIILADDEMICSVALAANISLLGLEEPATAEDVESMEELLQAAQSREGPLMIMVGKPDWIPHISALGLRRMPFIARGPKRSSPLRGEEDMVNLTIELRGLTISVSGSPTRAASLVRDLVQLNQERPAHHSGYSSEASSPPACNGAPETRESIEASFAPCPPALLALSTRLSPVGDYTATDRIRRAWRAGQWAGAAKRGRVSSPNRTPAIGIPNRVYIILQSERRSTPAAFFTSRSFFEEVGDLAQSRAICHGFGSEGEARACCAGAEEDYPQPQ
eukprot:s3468_g6.t3